VTQEVSHAKERSQAVQPGIQTGSVTANSTGNLADRLVRHNEGRSKYTKAKRPWELLYVEEHPDRSSAVKREREIKGLKV